MKYIGVDLGGTKIEFALVEPSGKIVERNRQRTPKGGKPKDVLDCLFKGIEELLEKSGEKTSGIAGIGVGVAGPVDPAKGRVVVTPNMHLSGLQIAAPVRKRFGVATVIGNDVNVGVMGEAWLGAARGAQSAVGIFVGTGIGGGVICCGKMQTGAKNIAGEIGHIVMQPGGPKCGCGQRGCLEALCSRTAIERDIREAVAAGRSTALTKILDGDLRAIRSGALRKALDREDELVTEIVEKAAEWLGYACVTVRHILDPEVIVLGGGVIEACGDFMMPIIKKILDERTMPGTPGRARLTKSVLGDDAGVLGAVALAQVTLGHRNGLDKGIYPRLSLRPSGELAAGDKVYKRDVYIGADGRVRKVKKQFGAACVCALGPRELKKVVKGAPGTLVVGTGKGGARVLSRAGEEFLRKQHIAVKKAPTRQAVREFNRVKGQKAALIHVGA